MVWKLLDIPFKRKRPTLSSINRGGTISKIKGIQIVTFLLGHPLSRDFKFTKQLIFIPCTTRKSILSFSRFGIFFQVFLQTNSSPCDQPAHSHKNHVSPWTLIASKFTTTLNLPRSKLPAAFVNPLCGISLTPAS